jgi:putative tryptophan/tyrosine transport system substrate-binding protein
MHRREFITLLGGAALCWPLGTRAQQTKRVISFFNSGKSSPQKNNVAAFRQGLKEAGLPKVKML